MATDTVAWDTLNLAEVGEALAQKRSELNDIFHKHPNYDMSTEVVEDVQQRNLDLQTGGKRFDALREAANVAKELRQQLQQSPVPIPPSQQKDNVEAVINKDQAQQFSLRKAIAEDETYLKHKGDAKPRFVIDIPGMDMISQKTLMTNTTGFPPFSERGPLVVPMAMRRPVVADLVPQDNIDQVSVIYMEETTFTNAAASVAEGAAKPESALAFTQRSVPVEVIATWIPITRQQLDDVNQLQSLVENRLRLMLSLTEETQLLSGSGVTPELTGFYNKAGIQTQAKGADPTPDAFFKAMTKIRYTGFADPSGAILHPNDWQDIRLLRTVNGEYIWGSPADVGVERLWGMPIVVTTAATENTGLVGDFVLYSHISRKMGVTLDISDQHSTYFVENKLAIRIEERLSLEIYRATAFCTVTGI